MTVLLWWCPNPDCTVYLFRRKSPICPGCGREGEAIFHALRPPRA